MPQKKHVEDSLEEWQLANHAIHLQRLSTQIFACPGSPKRSSKQSVAYVTRIATSPWQTKVVDVASHPSSTNTLAHGLRQNPQSFHFRVSNATVVVYLLRHFNSQP